MKCPKCVSNGDKSIVRVFSSSTTCLAGDEYYDEEGRHHWHDPNTRITEFRCSLGHEFVERTPMRSCWCDSAQEVQFKEDAVAEAPLIAPTAVVSAPEVTPQHKVDVKRHAAPRGIGDSYDALFGHPVD